MVDCFDRIHLQLNEVVLRPLKELQTSTALTSVTIRPPGRVPRVHVTVSKHWPDGPDHPPMYRWAAHEAAADAGSHPLQQIGRSDVLHTTPERAYWSSIDAIAVSRRSTPTS